MISYFDIGEGECCSGRSCVEGWGSILLAAVAAQGARVCHPEEIHVVIAAAAQAAQFARVCHHEEAHFVIAAAAQAAQDARVCHPKEIHVVIATAAQAAQFARVCHHEEIHVVIAAAAQAAQGARVSHPEEVHFIIAAAAQAARVCHPEVLKLLLSLKSFSEQFQSTFLLQLLLKGTVSQNFYNLFLDESNPPCRSFKSL